jgi:broad specificity phosphatase PhoE
VVEIVLVRHASTAWSGVRYCGRSDLPLSPVGLAEAAALARRLAPSLPSGARLISSPSRRAAATAEAIAEACGAITIEHDERWLEVDFGLAEGRTFEELQAIAPATAAAVLDGTTDIDWPGGETANSLMTRVKATWDELVAADRPAVVVTHAGPIVQALAFAGDRRPDVSDLLGPAMVARVTVAAPKASGSRMLPSGT